MTFLLQNITKKICNLCHQHIEKDYEYFLLGGTKMFQPIQEVQTLQFEVRQMSSYVCRQCIDKLKKRRNLIKQTLEIEIFLNSKQEQNTEKESGNTLMAAAKSSENTNARKLLRFSS